MIVPPPAPHGAGFGRSGAFSRLRGGPNRPPLARDRDPASPPSRRPARSTSPTATAAARSSRRSRPSTKRRPRNICPRALLGRFFVHSDGARASFWFAQLPSSRSLRPRADVASLQAWVWWARVGDLTSPTPASLSHTRSRCVLQKELKQVKQNPSRRLRANTRTDGV